MSTRESASKIIQRHIRENGLPEPVQEFLFDEVRKWRFDFSWPDRKVAIEIEGGVFSKGRHIRPKGFTEDIVKYNTAMIKHGWLVIRATTAQVKSGDAISWLMDALIGDDRKMNY